MRVNFTKAEATVREYCEADKIGKGLTKRVIKAVSDLKALSRLESDEKFIIWDALGLDDYRDDVSEVIYQFLSLEMYKGEKSKSVADIFLGDHNNSI